MRFRILIAALVAALFAIALPATAQATPTTRTDCSQGWYVNPDEVTRQPEQTEAGMLFKGNDLLHHAASTTTEDLDHGTFVASLAPDQPSFFSVEVSGSDGKYGTLRWNTTENYWEATSQGEQHHDISATALADAFPVHLSHTVVSFGVGYTNSPPGTVDTTVGSVTFMGKTYDLSCQPKPEPSASSGSPTPKPSTSASSSATPKPSVSSSSAPAGTAGSGTGLPVTGSPVGLIFAIGSGLALAGMFLYACHVLLGKRKRFEA